jgi:hypothetical protein
MVVNAYCMKRRKMSFKAALRQIILVRLQVSLNHRFLQQLKELEPDLRGKVSLDVDEFLKRENDYLALFAGVNSEDTLEATKKPEITESVVEED